MRLFLGCLCWLSFCAASAQTAPDASAALPAEAARLNAAYRAGLETIAKDYDASLLPLAENYVLELRRLSTRMKEAKDAAGMEAVRKEAGRFMQALAAEPDAFETVPELTADNVVETPEALRLIQEAYAARRAANDLARNEKVVALSEKYLGGLELLQARYTADGKAAEAAAAKKEATRLRVAMQRKDFATRAVQDAGLTVRFMPSVPDVAAIKEKLETAPAGGPRNLTALALNELAPAIQAFLMKPLDYDREWPPEITKWSYEGTGNYAHDFALYKQPGQPDELGIFAYPKTLRAYVRGTINYSTKNFDNKALSWMGKAMSFRLNDSRDLACKVVFRTQRPALSEAGGPAGCVAVYSIDEGNRLIASMSVPMLSEETALRMAKHYSYNRMNIVWDGTKRKRGFTIPDHMPMRVVAGIAGFAPGEQVDATIEVLPCGPLGDMW
ncbi:MAG TPA: hypothetical protein PLU38_09715 [Kiritimatiellia bacterium]|jgi:hypothetical protein|nr:MAG: hypothetical protein BWX70_01531 [Verrucomicrobia bacterium ADurb.Bin070]HPB10940.1 hypothetical protein [Kiritimatiellia bacterium]HQA38342.1 hypothetical protein [Kiritimatiellia bacterium]HQL50611.1 hypothetical protein [Kiritimatiellia bacterium]HQQ92129.1 hypothetical protein [Kiritimatiellia bacterium]